MIKITINKWMKWNTNLIKQWTDNKIGAEGAIQISESLKTNTTLTSLNLRGDKDNNKQMKEENEIQIQ